MCAREGARSGWCSWDKPFVADVAGGSGDFRFFFLFSFLVSSVSVPAFFFFLVEGFR